MFLSKISKKDLEKRQEYYTYYTNVPLCTLAYSDGPVENDDLKRIKQFIDEIQGNNRKLIRPDSLSDTKDEAQFAENFV